MIEQAVVLGASGGLGKAVVDALISKNIPTKALVRNIEKFKKLYPGGKLPGEVNVMEGELDSNQALAIACEHVDTIFVCFNTGYSKWEQNMTRWVSRICEIAVALNARIIYPGNIYNFSPSKALKFTEEHPLDTKTSFGQLCIAIESRLIRSVEGGASLSIVRLPQLFGPAVMNHVMYNVFTSALNNKPANWYGLPMIDHEFMFSKDAGEILVKVALSSAAIDTLLHHPGYVLSSHEWLEKVYQSSNSTSSAYNILSNLKIQLKAAFSRDLTIFTELLYIYSNSIIFDGSKFDEVVGQQVLTPLNEAIKQTLDWYAYWINL